MMLVEAIGIFAVAAVGGPTARLHVGHSIGLRTEHAKKRLGVHRSRTDLDVIWLLKDAIAIGPEFLKLKYKVLEVRPDELC